VGGQNREVEKIKKKLKQIYRNPFLELYFQDLQDKDGNLIVSFRIKLGSEWLSKRK
jgi:hypothetical protein